VKATNRFWLTGLLGTSMFHYLKFKRDPSGASQISQKRFGLFSKPPHEPAAILEGQPDQIMKTLSTILFALITVAAFSFDNRAAANVGGQPESTITTPLTQNRTSRLEYHDLWRKLWEDHITWTRVVILAILDDLASPLKTWSHSGTPMPTISLPT
jgi:hypothetical protein